MKKLIVLVALATMVSFTAGAGILTPPLSGYSGPIDSTDPNLVIADNTEEPFNLWRLIGHIYFGDETAVEEADLRGVAYSNIVWDDTDGDWKNARLEVKYAAFTHTFGMYASDDQTAKTPLFVARPTLGGLAEQDPFNPVMLDMDDNVIGPEDFELLSGEDGPFGFYIDSEDERENPPSTFSSYSIDADNEDGAVRMLLIDLHALGSRGALGPGQFYARGSYVLAFEDRAPIVDEEDPLFKNANDFTDMLISANAVVIPEPATMTLLGLGIAGIVYTRVRRRSAQK